MHFSSVTTTIIMVIVYIVVGAVSVAVVAVNIKRRWLQSASAVVIFLVLVGVINSATVSFTAIHDQFDVPMSDIDVANHVFGFESGKQYPLDLGDQTTSFSASVNVRGGAFTNVSVQIKGEPSFFVTYVHDGVLSPLILPVTGPTKFIDDEINPPTMVINFQAKNWRDYPLSTTDAAYKRHWSPCEHVFRNFMLACSQTSTLDTVPTISDRTVRAGLNQFVANSFESAEIHMSRKVYDQLIGRIQP